MYREYSKQIADYCRNIRDIAFSPLYRGTVIITIDELLSFPWCPYNSLFHSIQRTIWFNISSTVFPLRVPNSRNFLRKLSKLSHHASCCNTVRYTICWDLLKGHRHPISVQTDLNDRDWRDARVNVVERRLGSVHIHVQLDPLGGTKQMVHEDLTFSVDKQRVVLRCWVHIYRPASPPVRRGDAAWISTVIVSLDEVERAHERAGERDKKWSGLVQSRMPTVSISFFLLFFSLSLEAKGAEYEPLRSCCRSCVIEGSGGSQRLVGRMDRRTDGQRGSKRDAFRGLRTLYT